MSKRKPPFTGAATLRPWPALLVPALAVLVAASASPASASIRHHRGNHSAMSVTPDPEKDAALVLDGATGKVLYSRPNMDARERYEVSVNEQQYFEESDAALNRLAKAVAQQVVSGILNNF